MEKQGLAQTLWVNGLSAEQEQKRAALHCTPDESNGAVGGEVGENAHEETAGGGGVRRGASAGLGLPFDANVEVVSGTVWVANGAAVDLGAAL